MSDKRHKYFWHGKPVKYTFGYCVVEEVMDKPLWWWNFEVLANSPPITKAMVPAIKVESNGQSFCIANHYGIGAYKLKRGGWPDCAHFGLPIDTFVGRGEKFSGYVIRDFNEDRYAEHEGRRRAWQKKEYPDEFKKMEGLRKLATRKFKNQDT